MLNDLDPREKKAVIIFFAVLALILTYLGTHDLSFEKSPNYLEQSLDYQQIETPAQKPYSYESYL